MSARSRHSEAIRFTPSARRTPARPAPRTDGRPTEIRRTLHDCMHKAHSAFKSSYILDSNNTLPTHKYATTSAFGVLRARRTCAVTRRSTHSASTACDRTMRAPVRARRHPPPPCSGPASGPGPAPPGPRGLPRGGLPRHLPVGAATHQGATAPSERLNRTTGSIILAKTCSPSRAANHQAALVSVRRSPRPERRNGTIRRRAESVRGVRRESVRKVCAGCEATHLLPLHADVDLGAARGQRV